MTGGDGTISRLAAALAADSNAAVIYAEADGMVAFWNAGAQALFGYSADETAGRRIDLIVPEVYRAMHWTGFNRTIGSAWRGSEGWGPIEAQHKNGDRVVLEVFLTPTSGEDTRVRGVLAIFRRLATTS